MLISLKNIPPPFMGRHIHRVGDVRDECLGQPNHLFDILL